MAASNLAVAAKTKRDLYGGEDRDRQRHQFDWPYEDAPVARWSRLPSEASELSEADIRYSVRFKSRSSSATRSSRRSPKRPEPHHKSAKTGAAGKRAPAAGEKFHLAYALLIGILAGLAIPSVVVFVAVLIVNPSAVSSVFSKLLMAVAALG